jgi:hypothetical protein
MLNKKKDFVIFNRLLYNSEKEKIVLKKEITIRKMLNRIK